MASGTAGASGSAQTSGGAAGTAGSGAGESGGIAGGGSSGSPAGGNGGTATGGSGGEAAGGAAGMGGSGGTIGVAPFELTSPSLEEGGTFMDEHTCDGGNTSPELNWGPGPEGTASYAIAFIDETSGFPHWAIWNIAVDTLTLPADIGTTLPGSAVQVSFGDDDAYRGPCPGGPDPGNPHTYEFTLYALSVESIDPMPGNAGDVRDAIESSGSVLNSVTLGGSSLAGN